MKKSVITKEKRTKGRQKIPIKRLTDENSRQVTFSKRREGVYNKASELCILTGARVAIITFSPNVRKPFCFSHPEMDTILEAYLGGGMHDDQQQQQREILEKVFKEEEARIEELCWEPRQQSEAARVRLRLQLQAAAAVIDTSSSRFWWDEVCVEMVDDVEELEEFSKALTDVNNNLRNQLMIMSMNQGEGEGDHNISTTANTHEYQTANVAAAGCSSTTAPASLPSNSDDLDGAFDYRLLGFGDPPDYWNFDD